MFDNSLEFYFIILAAALLMLCLTGLIIEYRSGRWDLFSPMVPIASWTLFYFGVAPALRVIDERPDEDTIRLWTWVLAWIVLGWFLLLLTYNLKIWRPMAEKFLKFDTEWRPSHVLNTVLLLSGLSLIGSLIFFNDVGGLDNYLDNYGDRILLWNTGNGIYGLMQNCGQIALLLWFAYILDPKGGKYRYPAFLKWGVFGLLLVIYIIPRVPTGSRTGILWVFIFLLIIYHYMQRKVKLWELLLLASLGVIYIYVAGEVRQAVGRGQGLVVIQDLELSQESFYQRSVNSTYGGFIEIIGKIFERVPERVEYQWGLSYVLPIVYLVPRQLIQQKPLYPALLLTDVLYEGGWEGRSYLTPTMWGEAFMNLGYVGLLIIPIVYGIIFAVFREFRYLMSQRAIPAQVVMYVFLFQWANGVIIGDFVNVNTSWLAQLFLLTTICYGLTRAGGVRT